MATSLSEDTPKQTNKKKSDYIKFSRLMDMDQVWYNRWKLKLGKSEKNKMKF